MSVLTLAAELAATAKALNLALQTDDATTTDMVDALNELGDAGQYLGGALRVIAQAATAEYKATGAQEWDDLADEIHDAADLVVKGGLHVEEDVLPAAADARGQVSRG